MPKKILPPSRLMMLLTAAVFVAEFLLMMLLRYWSKLTELERAFADSFVLIVVLSPALYLLFYRPIRARVGPEDRPFVQRRGPCGGDAGRRVTFCLELSDN